MKGWILRRNITDDENTEKNFILTILLNQESTGNNNYDKSNCLVTSYEIKQEYAAFKVILSQNAPCNFL